MVVLARRLSGGADDRGLDRGALDGAVLLDGHVRDLEDALLERALAAARRALAGRAVRRVGDGKALHGEPGRSRQIELRLAERAARGLPEHRLAHEDRLV